MLPALAIALLALSPTMAGPPVAARGSVVDATASIFLAAPTTAQQCTNGAVTTDQSGTITVSRASSSYCQKADGTYVLIGSNKLVVEPSGFRVEPASSNRVPQSIVSDTNWTGSNATSNGQVADPMGGTDAYEWEATSNGGFVVNNDAFTAGATSGRLSVWVNGVGGGQTVAFRLRDTTAGADRCTGTVTVGVAWTTQALRASVACSGLTSGNNHVVRLYPGGTGSVGTAQFFGVQFEPSLSAMTSYIPTAGTTASRAADDVSITVADFDAKGCVSASVTSTTATYQAGVMRWFNGSGGSPLGFASSIQLTMHDNATAATLDVSDVSNRTTSARSQWSGTSMFIQSGGSTGTAGTFDGTMGTGGALTLGSASGVAAIGGWMKAVKFSPDPSGCAL